MTLADVIRRFDRRCEHQRRVRQLFASSEFRELARQMCHLKISSRAPGERVDSVFLFAPTIEE